MTDLDERERQLDEFGQQVESQWEFACCQAHWTGALEYQHTSDTDSRNRWRAACCWQGAVKRGLVIG